MLILQGKGWGWSVLYVSLAWLIAVFGLAIAFGYDKGEPLDSDRIFYRLCALWLTCSAMTVYVLDRWREARAHRAAADTATGPFIEAKRDDEFLYMRMWAWPYVLMAMALWALGASFIA